MPTVREQLQAQLESLLPDWELVPPLTAREALSLLTAEFGTGRPVPGREEQVRFRLRDVELSELTSSPDWLHGEPEADLARVRTTWEGCEVESCGWEAVIRMCGTLQRECVRISFERLGDGLVWHVRPVDEFHQTRDRRSGPMWEGW